LGPAGLREAVAGKVFPLRRPEADPEREVTVTCAAQRSHRGFPDGFGEPREKVIVFEPFYENLPAGVDPLRRSPRVWSAADPDWTLDPDELKKGLFQKPKA